MALLGMAWIDLNFVKLSRRKFGKSSVLVDHLSRDGNSIKRKHPFPSNLDHLSGCINLKNLQWLKFLIKRDRSSSVSGRNSTTDVCEQINIWLKKKNRIEFANLENYIEKNYVLIVTKLISGSNWFSYI